MMKRLLLSFFACAIALFAIGTFVSPPGSKADGLNLGCINYSGANYIGSVVLTASGTVIGCEQPGTGDSDLIPLGNRSARGIFFGTAWSDFITRLGFGCDDCWVGADGMGGTQAIPLGFQINYYGTTYDDVFVNSNGSISFNAGSSSYDQPLNEILGTSPGVCAYCLDLENEEQLVQAKAVRGSGRHTDFTYRGRTTFEGRPAFVATWMNVPTYSSNDSDGVWNTFQIMLVDTSDSNDDVNIIINYGSIKNQSDEGYCEGGEEGGGDCNLVAIGLGNVSGDATIYNPIVDDSGLVLNGLATSVLWDDGIHALNTLHLNSDIPGRFIFNMSGGALPGSIVDTDEVLGCTDNTAPNFNEAANTDDGSCVYAVRNFSIMPGEGKLNLTWDHPTSRNEETLAYYEITYNQIDLSGGDLVISGINNLTNGYLLAGLTPDVQYTVEICAVYHIGETSYEACTSSTGTPYRNYAGGGGGGGNTYPGTDRMPETTPSSAPTETPETSGPTSVSTTPPVSTPIETPKTVKITDTKGYPRSYLPAYLRALENKITTQPLEKARLEDLLQRYEAAKMLVNYVQNVEHKTITSNPECVITTYSDYPTYDAEMKTYLQKICDLGLMGWASPRSKGLIPAFRPFDSLTVEEFNIIINRYLTDQGFAVESEAKSSKRIDILNFLMETSKKTKK